MKRKQPVLLIQDSEAGFTLVELMVVIVIIAIIASFTFAEINTASYRLKTTARALKAHLIQAKLEAVKKGCKVRLKINTAKDGYTVSMLDDSDPPNVVGDPLRTISYPGKFTFKSSNDTTFTPLGTANSNSIAIVNQGTTAPEYKVFINNIGRVRFEKTQN